MLEAQRDQNRYFAAICDSPQKVFDDNGLIDNYKATGNPGCPLKNPQWAEERVIVDRNLITSRAAGTSIEFGLALVGALFTQEKAMKLGLKILHRLPKG